MSILALDFGLSLGWAVSFGSFAPGDVVHGTVGFKPGRYEGGGMVWLRFRQWLNEMAEGQGPIEVIYFEEVRAHAGTTAAHVYGGFLATLTAWAEKRSIPYQGVPVGTVKKAATGKGNAGKEQVIAAMRAHGFVPESDNDADALAILFCMTAGKEAA